MRIIEQRQSGFTVLEMAIVLIISGLLLAGFLGIVNNNRQVQEFRNNEIIARLQWGLAEHFRIFGYYPCPADPTLAEDHANYGEAQDCSALAPPSGVVVGAVPVNQLNIAVNCVDPAANSLPDNLAETFHNHLNTAQQFVRFGAQVDNANADGTTNDSSVRNFSPDSARCVSTNLIRDIYGSKITYAVTKSSTVLTAFAADGSLIAGTLDPGGGLIQIVNEAGNQAIRSNPHFVLVSHGPDQKGAFLANGNASALTCAAGSAAKDAENCNGDVVFRSMPYAGMETGTEAAHYDDIVAFEVFQFQKEHEVWRWADGNNAAGEAGGDGRDIYLDKDEPLAIGPFDGSVYSAQENTDYVDKARVKLGKGGNLTVGKEAAATPRNIYATGKIESKSNIGATGTAQAVGNVFSEKFCYDDDCDGPP